MADGKLVMLAAGGTGGHVFPARALAQRLIAAGHRVALITDRRGAGFGDSMADIETFRISAASPSGGMMAKLKGLASLTRGYFEARRLLREQDPAAVIGFGGYPSVPAVMAAARLGLPTMIHEQNAVLGRANRLLAPRVDRIATGFELVQGIEGPLRAKAVLTGNPVRPEIVALRDRPYPTPDLSGALHILVLGGSQGARSLSRIVPEAISQLGEALRLRLVIDQQCRAEDISAARSTYAAYRVKADLATFFDDVPDRLGRAHLVISRAGASTLAEISVAGRPAILVPYPHATDDHQAANARALASVGGAWIMHEDTFRPEVLADRLAFFLHQPSILCRAAERAREFGIPDAAARLRAQALALLAGDGDGNGAGIRQRGEAAA